MGIRGKIGWIVLSKGMIGLLTSVRHIVAGVGIPSTPHPQEQDGQTDQMIESLKMVQERSDNGQRAHTMDKTTVEIGSSLI